VQLRELPLRKSRTSRWPSTLLNIEAVNPIGRLNAVRIVQSLGAFDFGELLLEPIAMLNSSRLHLLHYLENLLR
jgi:hypothetical protein